MTQYVTRDLTKALALVTVLTNAGFTVQMNHHQGNTHIATNADDAQWATARASIGIPSSNPDAMPDPETVVVPDTIPFGWDKI